jgi:hypothetical protein
MPELPERPLRVSGGFVIGLAVALALVGMLAAWLIWAVWRRLGRHDRTWARLRGELEKLGARPLDERAWEFQGRRYELWIEPPTLLVDNLYVRLSLYTPRVFEFSLKCAQGVAAPAIAEFRDDPLYAGYDLQGPHPRELREFLDHPRTRRIVEAVVAGRWRILEQRALRLSLEDNLTHDTRIEAAELGAALHALRALDESPAAPSARPSGGTFTFRFGFEPDVPPWHWPIDEIRKLPRAVRRFAVSYYRDDPLLNEAMAALLLDLCGPDGRACFVTDFGDVSFVEHAFGPVFDHKGSVFETKHATAVAAADRFTDGAFFQGLACVRGSEEARVFEGARHHEFHEMAAARLDRMRFWARRLLDDEASWHSGEIEILTLELTEAEVRAALARAAAGRSATVTELDRRFSAKLFRTESFEYST